MPPPARAPPPQASHNSVDWVPMHANKKLLDVLRERFGLGHDGYVGSDNTNVEGLFSYFGGRVAGSRTLWTPGLPALVARWMLAGSLLTRGRWIETRLCRYADNTTDAAAMALAAGVDQDMPGAEYLHLASAVTSGSVPLADVERAVRNVLTKKFAARLFDADADPSLAPEIDATKHRVLARASLWDSNTGVCCRL
jgi:beta-glucosidase-like glycosyl hydrolase